MDLLVILCVCLFCLTMFGFGELIVVLLVFCYAVIRGFVWLGWVFVVLLSFCFLWGMICYFIGFGYYALVFWVS